MRLTINQVQVIRDTVQCVLAANARVSVFGSMALNDPTGGDIDLFFETDNLLANRAKTICQLYGALIQALGDRKIDVILKDANTSPAPFLRSLNVPGCCCEFALSASACQKRFAGA